MRSHSGDLNTSQYFPGKEKDLTKIFTITKSFQNNFNRYDRRSRSDWTSYRSEISYPSLWESFQYTWIEIEQRSETCERYQHYAESCALLFEI